MKTIIALCWRYDDYGSHNPNPRKWGRVCKLDAEAEFGRVSIVQDGVLTVHLDSIGRFDGLHVSGLDETIEGRNLGWLGQDTKLVWQHCVFERDNSAMFAEFLGK